MATLQLPNLPRYLYRYRSISPRDDGSGTIRPIVDRELESLKERYIYCSAFDKLNDPMEGFYQPSNITEDDDDYEEIANQRHNKKINIGIASFRDTKENELMWAHYAGNYCGICVEYYAYRLLTALPDDVNLVRVGYDDAPPRVIGRDQKQIDAAARTILSQKKYNWAYEREWRILGSIGRIYIASSDVVRSIYLGSRIDSRARLRILETFENSLVNIFDMEVDGYKHYWSPVQGPLVKIARQIKEKTPKKPA